MIRVESLSTGAGAFMLRDISFEVPAGEWCAIIGPTGSGKTTLLECLAGLSPSTSGRVTFGARDATRLPPEERDVALVYQQGYLFPHLTVGANISYGALTTAEAHALAGRFGLEDLWKRGVGALSGGERQLVALARALARRSPVLLLDEPFASLDFTRRARIRADVREIAIEVNATVLLVTHDLNEAAAMTKQAVHLARGRIAGVGTTEEILSPLMAGT